MAIRNLEWYDLNEQRSWPLEEQASGVDDTGLVFPKNLIADLHVRFPRTIGDFIYLSGFTVGPNIVSAVFVTDDVVPIPVAAVSIERPIDLYRLYSLESLYPGVGGWLVFGDGVNEIDDTRIYRFSHAGQSRITPHAARRYNPFPVSTVGKLNVADRLTGLVRLAGGDDIEIVKDVREINGVLTEVAVIRLAQDNAGNDSSTTQDLLKKYSGDCGGRPENRDCPGIEPIEFINGVPPDCCGNITLELRGCSDLSFVGNESCSVMVDCGFGLAEACVSPDRLPDAAGVLPNEYTDLCEESVSVIGETDTGSSLTANWFTLAVITDSALDALVYHAILGKQVDWLLANKSAVNIKMVSHVGSVVSDGGDTDQWDDATEELYRLDNLEALTGEGRVPFGVAMGNSDYDVPGNRTNATNYIGYLTPTIFTPRGHLYAQSATGRSYAHLFSFDGWTYLHLFLELEASGTELTWAANLLAANTDKPTIISTHRYIDAAGNFTTAAYGGSGGSTLYSSLVQGHDQVFLVLCGDTTGEYYRTDTNSYGNTVHTLLQRYGANEQWNAWMRLLEFDAGQGLIRVKTYSPIHDILRPASESLVIHMNWTERFGDPNGDTELPNSIWVNDGDSDLPYSDDFDDTVADDFDVKYGQWAVVADDHSGYSYEAASPGATIVGYADSWNIATYEGAITGDADWKSVFRKASTTLELISDSSGAFKLHNGGLILGFEEAGGWQRYISVELDWSGTFTGQKSLRIAYFNGSSYQTLASVVVPALALDTRYLLEAEITALDEDIVHVTAHVESVDDASVDVDLPATRVSSIVREGLFGLVSYRSQTRFNSFTVEETT